MPPNMPTEADRVLVDKLVLANRILYRQGVVDGFGHASVRHDQSPGHFLLARNMAPGLVRREDIVTFDLDGTALDASGRRVYLERFIHGDHRARPTCGRSCTATAGASSSGVTGTPPQPVFHMSGFLAEGSALFEIRDVAGDTDMLITMSPSAWRWPMRSAHARQS
jgi:HCOMODA/2-hydroxy-3-carboxy-muconic semialdehyde decarboxylase